MDMACNFCRLNKLDTVEEPRAMQPVSKLHSMASGSDRWLGRSLNDMLLTSSVQVVLRGRRQAGRGPLLRLPDRQVFHEAVRIWGR